MLKHFNILLDLLDVLNTPRTRHTGTRLILTISRIGNQIEKPIGKRTWPGSHRSLGRERSETFWLWWQISLVTEHHKGLVKITPLTGFLIDFIKLLRLKLGLGRGIDIK